MELAQEELAQLKGKQDELQKTFDIERTAWANDKKTLEDTIVDLSTSERNAETDRSSREDDIRQLEDRTKVSIYRRAERPSLNDIPRPQRNVTPTKSSLMLTLSNPSRS